MAAKPEKKKKKIIKLILPAGHRDIQIPCGLPDNPKVIDSAHDKRVFTDADFKGYVVIDEETARLIEPHLHHVPRTKIVRE